MRTLLNIIWLLCAGIPLFFSYAIAGLLACLLIITIPVGIASFRIAGYVLWPFGREVIPMPNAGVGSAMMNFIWFVFAGIWLALAHVISAMFLAVTIVGIPFAWANLKMIPLCAFPYGKQIINTNTSRIVVYEQ